MLEYSITNDLLIPVIDILHRFATVWACMDAMSQIVSALDSAHQVWRARGVRSRPLLGLILEFDHGRFLGDASRERVIADLASLSLVRYLFHLVEFLGF
jgi:mediator of RNA polymerase II transcription subunit 12, fungi type